MKQAVHEAYAYLPVIDDTTAAHIPSLVEQFQIGLAPSSDDQIERMVTKIALLYPNVKLSDVEAEARLELYVELLRDVPFDILSRAFKSVAQTSRFFPTVAEIRDAAGDELSKRRAKIIGLRTLKMKHDREWSPPKADDPVEWTRDAIRELGRFASSGVELGWFTQSKMDEAFA